MDIPFNTRSEIRIRDDYEVLANTIVPPIFQNAKRTALQAAEARNGILTNYERQIRELSTNDDLIPRRRQERIQELKRQRYEELENAVQPAKAAFESAMNELYNDWTAQQTISDTVLAETSQRLHSIMRSMKRISEHSIIQIYNDAREDRDEALMNFIELRYRSLVRQYTGKAGDVANIVRAATPESKMTEYIMAEQRIHTLVHSFEFANFRVKQTRRVPEQTE